MDANLMAFVMGIKDMDLSENDVDNIIHILADAKNIPVRTITTERLRELCEPTLQGLDPSCHKNLLASTLSQLDDDEALNPDDAETAIEYMQDIAALRRYATA